MTGEGPAIEFDRSTEHILLAAEMLLPKVVAQNDFESARAAAGLFVGADKSRPISGLMPRTSKNSALHFTSIETLRAVLAGERDQLLVAINRDARESAILFPEIEVVGIGK